MFFVIWFVLGIIGAIITYFKIRCDFCMFLIWILMGLFGLVLSIIISPVQDTD